MKIASLKVHLCPEIMMYILSIMETIDWKEKTSHAIMFTSCMYACMFGTDSAEHGQEQKDDKEAHDHQEQIQKNQVEPVG